MFDQIEQSFCGLSAASVAESPQDHKGVFFCGFTAVSDCLIKRCQRLLYQTQDARCGHDTKVGDGEDDSDGCVGSLVGQVVKQRRLSKNTKIRKADQRQQ